MDKIVSRLKHRSSCSSCSASIVYLFNYYPSDYSYCWGSLTPRYPYLKFNDLCGIVICDHSIVTDSRVDGLLQNYRHGEPPYWYAEGSIFLCALHPSGIPYGLRFAMEEFDEMIEDQDYLKLKPYIREVVNRTIHSLRPITNDLRK
ncbi:unnamed protein product [Debaryomyces tyrocola]|nr:unnamed protein product [Debaryomyces tyrocola]